MGSSRFLAGLVLRKRDESIFMRLVVAIAKLRLTMHSCDINTPEPPFLGLDQRFTIWVPVPFIDNEEVNSHFQHVSQYG